MPEGCATEGDGRAVGSTTLPRRRSAIACLTCHKRKVRCNVATSGPPCANCKHDLIDCRVPPRKRPAHHRQLAALRRDSESDCMVEARRPPASPQDSLRFDERSAVPLADQLWSSESSSQNAESTIAGCISPGAEKQALSVAKDDTWRQESDCDEGENCTSYAAVLDDVIAEDDAVPFYVGDQQGLGFIVDICKPDRTPKGNHYLIPLATPKSQQSEVLALLCMQGGFSLPAEGVCKALIRSYFYYVHPFLPIINVRNFFTKYLSGDMQKVNLLLLWSMFFAASNFADIDTCKAAGYASRKAMKRSMYRRAKCLYDADYEKDKIALIQSVMLMAFWYVDTEDRTGSWHWIGIAISLAQSIGLHRNPETDQSYKQCYSASQRPLWRRIWWSCYFRDAWLSLGMGRPMRINIDDCDTPMPSVDDFLGELTGVPAEVKDQYLPPNVDILARYWGNLLKLSLALGSVLTIHYKPPSKALASLSDIEANEKEVLQCADGCRWEGEFPSKVVELHLYQLQLYYEATVIALHRPYVLKGPRGVEATQQEAWRAMSLRKAKSAASNTNAVLNKLITMDLMHMCQSITVTALIPAMQIHLLGATSSNRLAQRLAQNQINLVMIAMGELRETYWAADFLYRLFSNAQKKLEARQKLPVPADSESDHARPMTSVSTVYGGEPSISEEHTVDDLLLPDEFLSNGWNPFLCMPDECGLSLDLDINSLFSSEEVNGM